MIKCWFFLIGGFYCDRDGFFLSIGVCSVGYYCSGGVVNVIFSGVGGNNC